MKSCDKKRCRYKGEPYIGIRDTGKHSKKKTYDLCHKHYLELCELDGSMTDTVRAFCEGSK